MTCTGEASLGRLLLAESADGGASIGPDQRISLEQAMLAYTIDAAFALRLEHRIGSLQPGKLADIAIIDGDVETTPPGDLGSLVAWKTFLGGQLVHDSEARV